MSIKKGAIIKEQLKAADKEEEKRCKAVCEICEEDKPDVKNHRGLKLCDDCANSEEGQEWDAGKSVRLKEKVENMKKAKEEEAEPEMEKAENLNVEGETEDEESEEEKKKKKAAALKGEGGGENPVEDTASATDANSSVSPNMGVPSTQNVYVPQSGIKVSREQVTPMGKSAKIDMTKSPLFINLSKQIEDMKDAMSKKLEATEKSMNDRLKNLSKTVEAVEKFYKESFHKAISENVAPEGVLQESFAKQLESGKIRFRNK